MFDHESHGRLIPDDIKRFLNTLGSRRGYDMTQGINYTNWGKVELLSEEVDSSKPFYRKSSDRFIATPKGSPLFPHPSILSSDSCSCLGEHFVRHFKVIETVGDLNVQEDTASHIVYGVDERPLLYESVKSRSLRAGPIIASMLFSSEKGKLGGPDVLQICSEPFRNLTGIGLGFIMQNAQLMIRLNMGPLRSHYVIVSNECLYIGSNYYIDFIDTREGVELYAGFISHLSDNTKIDLLDVLLRTYGDGRVDSNATYAALIKAIIGRCEDTLLQEPGQIF